MYGYVDGYFGLDFPAPADTSRPGFLYSHNRRNEFTVNQTLVGARYDDGRVLMRLESKVLNGRNPLFAPAARPLAHTYASLTGIVARSL